MILGSIITLLAILAGVTLLALMLCVAKANGNIEEDPDPQYSALDQKDGLR